MTFDGGRRSLWPATVNGVDVWIYRWTSCPLHVVEIVSSVHLRLHLLLCDGDDVVLRVSNALVGSVGAADRLVWAVCWLGRRHWAYSRNAYFQRIEDMASRLGAAQREPMFRRRRI
jgi:hypothetical protein